MTDLVVIGLGYVGLPLAHGACRAGLKVTGLDADQGIVDSLNTGVSHVDDLSNDEIASMLESGFEATVDPGVLSKARTVVICVPTPLTPEGGPDLLAVNSAAETISENLSEGCLVVLESTTWPGTTEEVLRPILERSGKVAGVDFHLAFSPERIDPGNPTYVLRNTPKVVGGLTPTCTEHAVAFYSQFVDTVVPAKGTREAEMAKLLENTYRHINIALVNEMIKFSHELEIDFWDVIRCASTKPFGFQPFYPGPGVGGHCIPIDPNYLSHQVRARLGYPFRFVELAQEVNLSMPKYVFGRIQELLNHIPLALRGSKVLLLGVTYKPGIADQRESPARPLGELLFNAGVDLRYYDPYVERWNLAGISLTRVHNLRSALSQADVVVHLQPHTDYGQEILSSTPAIVLDTRGVLTGERMVRL